MLDAYDTEIRSDAGRQAIPTPRESAKAQPPADEITGASASEQRASAAARKSARDFTSSAENPGVAGCDGAKDRAPERVIHATPHHDQTVVLIDDGGEAVHSSTAREGPWTLDRFANPIVAEITEIWRRRQGVVEAQRKLTLQAKADCRRFTRGDKAEAQKLYTSIEKGGDHPLTFDAAPAILPYLHAMEPLIAQRNAYERHLTKLGRALPIAHMADTIKGVNTLTLAKIVGELGDLSTYEKGIAGIWKRAGLAVIDGERQRLKAGEAALVHAYSPRRRAVFYTMQGPLMQAQGADGPYRLIYDARKAMELERGIPKAHAHNRACRHMIKRLLKDLWREWRAVA